MFRYESESWGANGATRVNASTIFEMIPKLIRWRS